MITAFAALAAQVAATEQVQAGDAKKGSIVFERLQCFTCHPGGGNVINPARPIKGKAFNKRYPEDAQIADILRQGNPGTAMPAYSTDRLSDSDLTDLIAYVRSLTPQSKGTPNGWLKL
jgi:mono/diheme cytochrome c family protein